MNADEQVKIYNKGFLAGKEHSKPSPETKEFMVQINSDIKHINEKLSLMPTKEEMKNSSNDLLNKVEELFKEHEKESDKRYAVKQVEDAVEKINNNINWAVKIVVGLVMTAIIMFFLNR